MIKALLKKPSHLILYISIFSFALIGAECEEILLGSQNVVGVWELQRQEGASQDVCDGEIVDFGSDGIAQLQCPGQSVITRNYSVSGSTLTYTQTGIQYRIETASSSQLILNGINVNRRLEYNAIVTDNVNNGKVSDSGYNSSEN